MTVLYEHGRATDAATTVAGIYYWKNLINGKGYVGKTLNLQSRMSDYIGMQFKAQRAFYAAVKKYDLKNFTCYKVMDCCPSDVALNYWETFWIKELNTFIDGGHGYNLTTGGDGGKLSVETRQKMSDAKRGIKFSAETRKKLSDAQRGENNQNYGKKFSDEHRKKIGDAKRGEKNPNYGKKLSAETRKKMSDARRGKKRAPFSAEHRKKISDAWVLRRKSKLVQSGTLYSEFFIF